MVSKFTQILTMTQTHKFLLQESEMIALGRLARMSGARRTLVAESGTTNRTKPLFKYVKPMAKVCDFFKSYSISQSTPRLQVAISYAK